MKKIEKGHAEHVTNEMSKSVQKIQDLPGFTPEAKRAWQHIALLTGIHVELAMLVELAGREVHDA